jgi:hypothetical protein
MKKIKMLLKAAAVITVLLALILPSSAFVINKNLNKTKIFNEVIQVNIVQFNKLLRTQNSFAGENILVSGLYDDILPSICYDPYGNTVVTYTIQPSLLEASMGISWSDSPTNPDSWDGWKIDLEDPFSMFFDTAKIEGPQSEYFKGLFGVYIAKNQEEAGYYTIENINADPKDPNDWIFATWHGGAPEPKYACISDTVSYINLNYPNIIGPFNFFIYNEIYSTYDIESCPICFHTGIEAHEGVGYFDGQANEATAPASDLDFVDLGDRFHTIIQYNNPNEDPKLVWKKIVPNEQPDYEFTFYQDTIANGTNPSIAAYKTKRSAQIAVAYVDSYVVKCIYSSDDGENWNTSIIGIGTFPDIYASGEKLYCAFINSEDLFLSHSEDGGEIWSAPEQINDKDGSVFEKENSVDLHQAGIVWVDNRGSDLDIYWSSVEMGNEPCEPEINGQGSGKPETTYTYEFISTDPDGDKVSYFIKWDDGSTTGWTDFQASGPPGISESHTWNEQRRYTIQAKAKDIHDFESEWADFEVEIKKTRTIFLNSWFIRFLQQSPILQFLFLRLRL